MTNRRNSGTESGCGRGRPELPGARTGKRIYHSATSPDGALRSRRLPTTVPSQAASRQVEMVPSTYAWACSLCPFCARATVSAENADMVVSDPRNPVQNNERSQPGLMVIPVARNTPIAKQPTMLTAHVPHGNCGQQRWKSDWTAIRDIAPAAPPRAVHNTFDIGIETRPGRNDRQSATGGTRNAILGWQPTQRKCPCGRSDSSWRR